MSCTSMVEGAVYNGLTLVRFQAGLPILTLWDVDKGKLLNNIEVWK